jgi:hypothetical protein
MDKPDSIQMSATGAFAKPTQTATPIHDPQGTTLAQHSQRTARKISNRMEQEPAWNKNRSLDAFPLSY